MAADFFSLWYSSNADGKDIFNLFQIIQDCPQEMKYESHMR